MSQMLDIGWRKTIEGGPKHCENQQESSIFDTFWSAFWEINTSRTLLDPKNEDPESYRPIRAKKFRTRFCGHLFSHQLQNSAYLPLGKGFPTTWGGCKWVKWVICELYCGMDWLDTGGFVGSGDLWVLGAWGRSASWADLLQGGWWWCDEPLLSTL